MENTHGTLDPCLNCPWSQQLDVSKCMACYLSITPKPAPQSHLYLRYWRRQAGSAGGDAASSQMPLTGHTDIE